MYRNIMASNQGRQRPYTFAHLQSGQQQFTSASNTRDLILHNFSYYMFGLATGSLFHPCQPQ